jgi:hypothetical protein
VTSEGQHLRGVFAVDDSPVTGDEPVPGVAEEDLPIRDSGRQGVSPVEEPGRLSVQPDSVDAVPVTTNVDTRLLFSAVKCATWRDGPHQWVRCSGCLRGLGFGWRSFVAEEEGT